MEDASFAPTVEFWTCWVKQCPSVRMMGTREEMEEWKRSLRADPVLGRLLVGYNFTWQRGIVPEPEAWDQDEYEAENNQVGLAGYVQDALDGLDFDVSEIAVGDPMEWFDE